MPTVAAHLVFTFGGTVDDLCGDASAGEVVRGGCPVVVVVAEVAASPQSSRRLAGDSSASSAGADQGLASVEPGERVPEPAGAKLAAVVAQGQRRVASIPRGSRGGVIRRRRWFAVRYLHGRFTGLKRDLDRGGRASRSARRSGCRAGS